MEPWLNKRSCNTSKGALVLSPQTEKTLSALSGVTGRFLKTLGRDFWHDPYVSALQYYFSIVPAIIEAKNAYPFFCGKGLSKETLAVSILLNPDLTMGMKEPLLRYAKAMPAIAKSTVRFSTSAEYSLFIFCYRTLVYVLEELLLAVKTVDVRESFSALYELDSAFEALRLLFLKCASSDDTDSQKSDACPDVETLIRASVRCVDALRIVSKEFYIVEMLIFKSQSPKANKDESMERRSANPDVRIDEEELNTFLKKLAHQ